MTRRHRTLPDRGALLVSTDLHGNLEDFERLRALFAELSTAEAPAHWVILGDLVHGPDDEARELFPELYGYEDRSPELVEALVRLMEAHPAQVHYVLGNHDHAHVGGPRTRKFHADEAAALEARMSEADVARLRGLFAGALLLVTTPCGAALCHGAPAACISKPSDLDGLPLPCRHDWERSLVMALTTAYGQPREVIERFLAAASREGPAQRFVIHGHDRAEEGFFVEGENQLCPVIFGAPRENKRCVVLDLGARYQSVRELRDGVEIVRLYG